MKDPYEIRVDKAEGPDKTVYNIWNPQTGEVAEVYGGEEAFLAKLEELAGGDYILHGIVYTVLAGYLLFMARLILRLYLN